MRLRPGGENACCDSPFYVPWYAGRFKSIHEVADYWRLRYPDLQEKTRLFTDAFYDTTLPDEVMEAVSANLTISQISNCAEADRRPALVL